jgi:cellulose synthase/poly-beta-1,6-N-acetylglucosamine synthase-like glycosyltransferase
LSAPIAEGVSFVVPVRNGAQTLHATLASIAAQDAGVRPREVIVVDDGSEDGSRAIVDASTGVGALRVLDGPRRGAAAAVNCGVRAARYPIVAQVDQDVVLEPDWLERVLEPFADARVGAVQGRYVAGSAGSVFSRVMALDLEQRYASLPETVDHVCTGNSAYRVSALDAVGLLNEDLGYGYDNDLSYRLSNAGYRLIFRRDARSHHSWRDGFAGYLKQQYGFGYGRLDVVAAHPARVAGDDVSPPWMMAQPVLTAAALVCFVAALSTTTSRSASLLTAGLVLTGAIVAERTVAGIRAWRRFKDPAALAFPAVHTLRNAAWVAAMCVWCCRRLMGRPGSPAASMKPRPVIE